MLKDTNIVNVSGKIFWSKLDEKESYSMLRLGIDIGDGSYNRVFVTISNPNEKAYAFVKTDNQVIVMGAWIDTWVKDNGSMELQIKAYDSNVQFYLPDAKIPHFNEVFVYGKVEAIEENLALIDICGNRNPKTNQLTHRKVPLHIPSEIDNPTGKKIFFKGKLGTEEIEGTKKSIVKIFTDYDDIYLM